MAEQLSIDSLRAQMAAATAARHTAPEAPQAAPEPVEEKIWASEARRNLIHTMIFERYLPEQAEALWGALDWKKIKQREFSRLMADLKNTPRLPEPLRKNTVTAPAAERKLDPDFPHGTYTVQYADGSYKVIRIRIQPLDDDFMPGVALIGYQNGPSNVSDFRNFANVRANGTFAFWRRWSKPELERAVVAILEANGGIYTTPEGERVEVTKSDNCAKCGQPLTAPSDKNPYRDAGYGPKCGPAVGLKL